MDHSTVAAAVHESMSQVTALGSLRKYCVWGSSLGWLVVYGAVTYGWPSIGVELLGTLSQEAAQLSGRLGVAGEPGWVAR
jgi:hypothetical protein